MLHVLLATLAPQRHTIVLSLPVLCADLRTMQNLVDEIGSAYSVGLAGEDDVMQYADIAEWQRELLASDDTRAGREFWRDYFRKLDYTASKFHTFGLRKKRIRSIRTRSSRQRDLERNPRVAAHDSLG